MRQLASTFVLGLSLAACASSSMTDDGDDNDGDDVVEERTCLSPTADRAGTATLADAVGTARVEISDADACHRAYTLTSTASLRDSLPANGTRAVDEVPGSPTLRTGHDMFDALHALALSEVRENSVASISDFAFGGGAPLACAEGGCFETGRLWTYVWTRDLSYSVDLGLAGLDPMRAKSSLEFKLSGRRDGGAEEIVQDTGSGGSYPVSSDRVVWALGAAALLPHLDGGDRMDFAARAGAALAATIEHDRAVVYDPADGLYTGEQSFLDWREQSYPAWTAQDVAPIASSRALSTNLLHLRALEVAADLGYPAYQAYADDLRARIRERFWLPNTGLYSTFVTTYLDPAPARQYDLLGNALAILTDVATPEQADSILARYPHAERGAAPVIFPQQQLTSIYHNRAEWPFVTAYWLRAAAHADQPVVATAAIRSLMRGAAVNLSNMENFEIETGAAYVDDGAYSGPIVNSQRQLWSVAGYLSMVHHTLFGLRFSTDGVTFAPYVPADVRDDLFAATSELILNDVPYLDTTLTVVLHLPPTGTPGTFTVDAIRLNGAAHDGVITRADLEATNRIDIDLAAGSTDAAPLALIDATDWRTLFAPRAPALSNIRRSNSDVAFDLSAGGEDTQTIRYNVYRDGEAIQSDLAGSTGSVTDANGTTRGSPCYAAEACFTTTGNCSQRSAPVCFWGDNTARIQSFYPASLQVTGGITAGDHGRPHIAEWGDVGDTITVPAVTAAVSGPHLVQLTYGNGAGPINTGITCGIKRITVVDTATNQPVGSAIVIMPQLGSWSRWSDSTFAAVDLQAGRTYRIVVSSDETTVNMSAFLHFQTYVNTGGAAEFGRVNISEVKLLAR